MRTLAAISLALVLGGTASASTISRLKAIHRDVETPIPSGVKPCLPAAQRLTLILTATQAAEIAEDYYRKAARHYKLVSLGMEDPWPKEDWLENDKQSGDKWMAEAQAELAAAYALGACP